jgi:Na+/H+-dicarboxylate symporter/ABC-type amino acid transport substrate-binding protein
MNEMASEALEPQGQKSSLSTWIIGGLLAGVVVGLFFGERVAFFGVVGDAFIGLLQMTVLPYIVVSLLANLGRLSVDTGRYLVLRAGALLGILLLIGLLVLVALPFALPDLTAASFFSLSLVEDPAPLDFVGLYIPANPFGSLADNVVPAVVLFCVLLGVALASVPGREGLLHGLDVLADALNRVNKLVIKLTPFGVFAIAASTAGTMTIEDIGRVQGYLILYTIAALVLTFWVLPGLVSALTPFGRREVLGIARNALITIFAAGKIIVVLPQLIDNVKELFRRHDLDDDETDATADLLMPLAYPFPNLGTLVILVFVPFAGWYIGRDLSVLDWVSFFGAGLLSSFVAPVIGVPFLLNLLEIPADMFQLFVVSTVYTDRIRVVLGAVHLLVLTILVAAMGRGVFKVKWRSLGLWAATSVVLMLAVLIPTRLYLESALADAYTGDADFARMRLPNNPVPFRAYLDKPPPPVPHDPERSRNDEIVERGRIRVGFLRDKLPFAYVNASGQPVGFDIEMAHELAGGLGVELELVRLDRDRLAWCLDSGVCDVIMSGVIVTAAEARTLEVTKPYLEQTLAFIVQDHRRLDFGDVRIVRRLEKPRIGLVVGDDHWASRAAEALPSAEIVKVDSPRPFFRGETDLDALVYSAEAGSAWTLLYPDYSVVVPRGSNFQVPTAYVAPQDDPRFRRFLDRWIEIAQRNGSFESAYRWWILGEGAEPDEPRWCIARDVLGWIE